MKLSHRFSQGPFNRPPALDDATRERLFRYSQFFRPRCNALRLPIQGQQMVTASVSALLFGRCPAAIRWPAVRQALCALAARVVPVVVNAVNLMRPARTRPHVGKKIGKAIQSLPTPTHLDSTPAPVAPLFMLSVCTSLVYLAPRAICNGMAHSVGSPETAARFGVAGFQAAGPYGFLRTALAAAPPPGCAVFDKRQPEYRQPIERWASGQVLEICGALDRLARSHVNLQAGLRGQTRQGFAPLFRVASL
jgi:hypothetical protein